MSNEEGRAVWVTRDRAEAAEAEVAKWKAEVKRMRSALGTLYWNVTDENGARFIPNRDVLRTAKAVLDDPVR